MDWSDMEPPRGETMMEGWVHAPGVVQGGERLPFVVDRYRDADGVSTYRYTVGNLFGSLRLAHGPVLAQVLRIGNSKLDRVCEHKVGAGPRLRPPPVPAGGV